MKYMFDPSQLEELEQTLCTLESLGTILKSLCDPDREAPDLTSLADLGDVIAKNAMQGLNIVCEKERVSAHKEEGAFPRKVAVNQGGPIPEFSKKRIWFVPEATD